MPPKKKRGVVARKPPKKKCTCSKKNHRGKGWFDDFDKALPFDLPGQALVRVIRKPSVSSGLMLINPYYKATSMAAKASK
jgi:hypothetical protein